MTRLLQNTSFQVAGLAVAAIGLGTYINSQNHRASLEKRAADLAAVEQQTDESTSATTTYQQEAEEAREAANAHAEKQAREAEARRAENNHVNSQSANLASTADAATTSSSSQAASPSPSPSAAPTAAAVETPRSIQISFIELPRPAIVDLFSQGRQAGGDGAMGYVVLNDAQAKLKAVTGVRVVDKGGSLPLRMNQPASDFKGMHDPQTNQNIGFALQVIPISNEEGGMRMQIDVNRVLKDPSTGLESFDFPLPDSFVLQKRSAVIFTGALPHRPLFEGEALAYRGSNVLNVMTTAPFRQGVTDLAIVIEAK